MKIVVLGAGMVGRAMAWDLAGSFEVYSLDVSEQNLKLVQERNPAIRARRTDLSDYTHYPALLAPFDLVVTAVPGFMGYKTLEAVIRAGKDVADISFFPENVLDLNDLAKENGVTVITDVGIAPGMSNLILGRYNEVMEVNRFECYVGGLPKIRKKPFEYKAPFSPVDVIEEYTRPARLKENGQIVVKPALTEREWLHFDGIGTLEACNTDGLRSLLYTMPHIRDMKEKTLRYPGHYDTIIALREAGFFSPSPLLVDGQWVSPLALTSQVLFQDWKLKTDEEELTVMKVIINGQLADRPVWVEYQLLDHYDPQTRISSMSRTTGYTCTAAAQLIAQGLFRRPGVFPPELVGSDIRCYDFVMSYLRDRGVTWTKKTNMSWE